MRAVVRRNDTVVADIVLGIEDVIEIEIDGRPTIGITSTGSVLAWDPDGEALDLYQIERRP